MPTELTGDRALLQVLQVELAALRLALIEGSRRSDVSLDSASPRHVAIALASRGVKLVSALTVHAARLDHDQIAIGLLARDCLVADCRGAISELVARLSALYDTQRALESARLALQPSAREAANPELSHCFGEIGNSLRSCQAKLDEFGATTAKLEELERVLLRLECAEAQLLAIAFNIVELAAALGESVWDELDHGAALQPSSTTFLSSMAQDKRTRSGDRPPSVHESSEDEAGSLMLLRSLDRDEMLGLSSELKSMSMASNSTRDQPSSRGWGRGSAPMDTSMGTQRARPLRDMVGELRARCGLRAGKAEGLHPLITIACCETVNNALIVGAISRFGPVYLGRAPDDYSAPAASEHAPSEHAGEVRGVRHVTIGGRDLFLKQFPIAQAGDVLWQELRVRAHLDKQSCTRVEGIFVHGPAVWLEICATPRNSLADIYASEGLCRSWAHDMAPWRTLDAFRSLLGTIAAAHQARLVLASVLDLQHLIIDSQRGVLLLNSLWRARALESSGDELSVRWPEAKGYSVVDPTRSDVSFADDMFAFGRALYAALMCSLPPDHPQLLETELRQGVADVPTRELLASLLSADPDQRPSAAMCMGSEWAVTQCDRMRFTGAVVGLEHRKEVWLAHAKCLTQLSIELPPFRIVAKRASVVLDVLGKFSSMRSTQDLLKPIECSFEGVEHVAQGVGVTREVFTSLFDALKAEADSAAPGRVFDRAVDGDGGDPVYLPSTRASPQQCEAVGRVLLRLLLMGLPCPLKLAPSLVKSLACSEEELTIDDLAHWDAQLAAQLRGLAAASPLELAAMELSFTELEDPRRVDEPVAASNLRDFVKHKLEHALERSRTDQVTRLVYGFRAIPTLDCVLDLLGARGLDALLISSAVRVLDPLLVARSLEWRDWPVDSMVPALLTQCIMRLDQSRLRRFIRLTTSQNVWPTEGFTPPITIQRCPASEQLPVGSTCFHILRVPDYADPRSVESKLLMALDHVGEQDMGYV